MVKRWRRQSPPECKLVVPWRAVGCCKTYLSAQPTWSHRKEQCAGQDILCNQLFEELRKWDSREQQSELERLQRPSAYLAQDSEAWFRVQFWLFQLHHSYPAIFIQVLFVIVITQAQWVHLGNKRTRKLQFTGCRYD